MRSVLFGGLALLAALKLLVWWLEPRMAFFPSAGVQQTPAAARVPYADVKIPTADGETLHGWWLDAPSARAQVIYWHGNGGNLSLWLPVTTDLRARGFSVLAMDYRGYGASSGTPSERGIYRDVEAVTRYFDRHLRKSEIPTVYWGRSLGCAAASFAATVNPPEGIVLESPFPDVASLFASNPLMRVLSVFSSYRFPTSDHLLEVLGPAADRPRRCRLHRSVRGREEGLRTCVQRTKDVRCSCGSRPQRHPQLARRVLAGGGCLHQITDATLRTVAPWHRAPGTPAPL